MKRYFSILLTIALMLSLCACGAAPAPTEAPAAPSEAPPAAAVPDATDAPQEGAPKVDESQTEQLSLAQTLLQDEDYTFSITGAEFNEHLGLQIHVLCENNSDRDLLFTWDKTSVCNIMYDPFWAEEVAPGKKVNSTVEFDTYALEQVGVESVDEISFTLSVMDSENFLDGPLEAMPCSIYPTGKHIESVIFPEYQHKNGETIITDQNGITFIIESVEDEVSEYYTLNCYIANDTANNLMFSWDSVSVNGFMVDPFWAAQVLSGRRLYTQINFLRSDLEEQGIEDVSNIEFTLIAYDDDNWDADPLLEEKCSFNP